MNMMLTLIRKMVALGFVGLVLTSAAVAADEYSSKTTTSAPRYTFSWPLDGSTLKPRGGSTKGPPVTLDRSEAPSWKALQAPDISAFERDRRAILAMAGDVPRDVRFPRSRALHRRRTSRTLRTNRGAPRRSTSTSTTANSISLVHILEMRIVKGRLDQRADGHEALAPGLALRAEPHRRVSGP